jgi:predicted metal-dependent hydrolase
LPASTGRYSLADLPRYRYLPGRDPHPVRDPLGHSYRAVARRLDFDPTRWPECDGYLYAIDLWNEGYYWEVHEVLEDLWRETRAEREDIAGLLKGIIQAAAALLKHALDEPKGAARLAARAGAALRAAPSGLLGFDAHELAARVESFVAGRADEPPRITLSGVAYVDAATPSSRPT